VRKKKRDRLSMELPSFSVYCMAFIEFDILIITVLIVILGSKNIVQLIPFMNFTDKSSETETKIEKNRRKEEGGRNGETQNNTEEKYEITKKKKNNKKRKKEKNN
jgi:hypothetical protein